MCVFNLWFLFWMLNYLFKVYDKYEFIKFGFFYCFDSLKFIFFLVINDDYCDCLDGLDELGIVVCSNGLFWCKNEGYIFGLVRKSRVNDGLCGK